MKGIKILLVVMLVSLLVMGSLLVGRGRIEGDNKSVEVVLDYYEFAEMARQSEQPLSWWFNYFSKEGIQYVALREESLSSMVEEGKPLTVTMMGNLVKELNWDEEYPEAFVNSVDPEKVNPYDVVAYTDSEELYDFIAKGLKERYPEDRFELFQGQDDYVIVIKGTLYDALFIENQSLMETSGKAFVSESRLESSKLTRLGLGLDPEKVAIIQENGLAVMARPYSYGDWSTEKHINATLAEYEAYGIDPPVYIFDGHQVMGYPEHLDPVAEHMRNEKIKVGLIETGVQRQHMEQEGINLLADAVSYNAVRIYSLQKYVQERFQYAGYDGAEEIENTLYRAVTERNIRLIYLKPFKYDNYRYVTEAEEYSIMLNHFEERIAEHGLTLGESSTFEVPKIRVRHYTLLGWGIAAAGVLLLHLLFGLKDKQILILLALCLLGVPAMILVMPSLADKILALAASIIFASLSMAYFCQETHRLLESEDKGDWKKTILPVLKGVIVTSLISVIGAFYVATILSDIRYLLEMDIYRGVKVSQLIPFIFFIMFYLKYYGYKRTEASTQQRMGIYWELKKLLLEDIKVIYVLIGAVVLFVGYIYMARTGHETTVQASQLEILVRNMLENKLLARPRIKEFLIGIPALTLGIYAAKRGYKNIIIFAAGFAAVLGQTSIINTFSHLRTPLYLSAVRTVYGIILGVIIGTIGILLLELIRLCLGYMKNKYGIE
ncbi:DUF5693 family protein [Alkaliphilus crotonatoxidans]